MIAAPPTSPLELVRTFVGQRWPDRLREIRGGDPRQIARLAALIRAELPPSYLRFLSIAGGQLPVFGMFKANSMTVEDLLRHHESSPPRACPPDHTVIGVSRDPLGANFLVLALDPGTERFELPVYYHYIGTELDPMLLVSLYFEDCVALELFDALALATCRHRVEWTTMSSPEAFQQFEAEDPAPIVGDALAELGLLRLNANPHCAMYSDGGGRHLSYRTISDTRFFELQAGCHTAEELAAIGGAVERRLQQTLIASAPS